ncbi:MAG: NAD(P)-dependent alcohol dehydrogenase [Solirubrobacterales bacterium]
MKKMKAIVQREYGEPEDVLSLEEIAPPEIGENEVLIRVRSAGVDQGVWHLTAGLPYPVRAAGYGLRAPKNIVPGMDVAGIIEATGSAVDGLKPGDAVFGIAQGSFAELARAEAEKIVLKPESLSFEQAAAMSISGTTALEGLRDRCRVGPGQRVLILGASGGVGGFAVQIAKALGAEVTGVASSEKLELVRSLGADHVIDYKTEDFAQARGSFDVIMDTGGNRSLTDIRRVLAPKGRLLIVGGESDGRWLGGTGRQLKAMALSPFVSQTLGTFITSESGEDIHELKLMVEAGQIRPEVDRTFPLEEATSAIRYLRQGRARGKVTISI